MKELINAPQTMSSREIARLTGKRHSDVLEAIRNMEPAWEKITQRKFPLSEYTDPTGRKLPQYELNKTECLYVATKFNDEARARLIIRWAELEEYKQNPVANLSKIDLAQMVIESEREKERLQIQNQLQEQELQIQAPKVAYYDEVLQSQSTYNTNQIAKELGMAAITLNKKLQEMKVQYKQNGCWLLYHKHQNKGYTKTKTHSYTDSNGQTQTSMQMVWTEEGRRFIHHLFGNQLKIA